MVKKGSVAPVPPVGTESVLSFVGSQNALPDTVSVFKKWASSDDDIFNGWKNIAGKIISHWPLISKHYPEPLQSKWKMFCPSLETGGSGDILNVDTSNLNSCSMLLMKSLPYRVWPGADNSDQRILAPNLEWILSRIDLLQEYFSLEGVDTDRSALNANGAGLANNVKSLVEDEFARLAKSILEGNLDGKDDNLKAFLAKNYEERLQKLEGSNTKDTTTTTTPDTARTKADFSSSSGSTDSGGGSGDKESLGSIARLEQLMRSDFTKLQSEVRNEYLKAANARQEMHEKIDEHITEIVDELESHLEQHSKTVDEKLKAITTMIQANSKGDEITVKQIAHLEADLKSIRGSMTKMSSLQGEQMNTALEAAKKASIAASAVNELRSSIKG